MKNRTVGSLLESLAIGLLIGLLWAAVARSQTPQVSIEPRIYRDTVVRVGSDSTRPVLFGFDSALVARAHLPYTTPARAFCVRAYAPGPDLVIVDSLVSIASPEFPACAPQDLPLVIRPVCELTFEEHVVWTVQKARPAILFCGVPPNVKVLLFARDR